ncbi:MAG: GNAT family N-acetyltransferase [Oscillospiraceae bacterium]|nr:GNAT family N-acetyltransferase [Oscillospiraceae bacterium]
MTITKITLQTYDEAITLVKRVFMKFEAPEYPEEGIKTFMDFVDNKAEASQLEMYGAFVDNTLAGIIATRMSGKHISLFFVDEKYQGRGIGSALMKYMINRNENEYITVNSSPYAVEIYKNLGFKAMDKEKITDGIRYTPMKYRNTGMTDFNN